MKRKRFIECLYPLALFVVLGLIACNPVSAWGPFSHGVIAGAAAETRGMPSAAMGPDYIHQVTTPKALEYTELSYAEFSYNFSQTLISLAGSDDDMTQALAWGSFQTAERSGDSQLFHTLSQNTYQRWLDEILCDALLFSWVDSRWHGLVDNAGVAVRPKLVSDASGVYTAQFGGMPFGGLEALTRTHFQATVMVGEMAVIQNPLVHWRAITRIDIADWDRAMEHSVAAVADYAINGTRGGENNNWMVGNAQDYGSQLLGKLGSTLVATGDATISVSSRDGVWSYRFELTTDRVNEITVTFLGNVARNLDEHPTIRFLARSLYNMMTAQRID
jgi:hypothetical protein